MTPAEQKDAEANGAGLKEIKSEVSSDSSSEDIPPFQKRSRRKECIYITIAVVLGAGLIAVLVYFSVTNALKEDDPVERKSTGDDDMPSTTEDYASSYDYQSGYDDSNPDDYGSAGDPTLFGRQTRGGFVTRDFVQSAEEESVDQEIGDPSPMLRLGPNAPQTRMGGGAAPQPRSMLPPPQDDSGSSSADNRGGPAPPPATGSKEIKKDDAETNTQGDEEPESAGPPSDSGEGFPPAGSPLPGNPNLQKIDDTSDAKSTAEDTNDKTDDIPESTNKADPQLTQDAKITPKDDDDKTDGNTETEVADESKTEDASEIQQAEGGGNGAPAAGGMPPNIDRSMLLRRLRQPPNPADTTNED